MVAVHFVSGTFFPGLGLCCCAYCERLCSSKQESKSVFMLRGFCWTKTKPGTARLIIDLHQAPVAIGRKSQYPGISRLKAYLSLIFAKGGGTFVISANTFWLPWAFCKMLGPNLGQWLDEQAYARARSWISQETSIYCTETPTT